MTSQGRSRDKSTPAGTQTTGKLPFRYTIEWCSAEHDMEAAKTFYDVVVDFIEENEGHAQGGGIFVMSPSDVYVGSPLAKDLYGLDGDLGEDVPRFENPDEIIELFGTQIRDAVAVIKKTFEGVVNEARQMAEDLMEADEKKKRKK